MKRLWGLAVGLALVGGISAVEPPEVAPPPKSTTQVLAKMRKDVEESYNRAIEPLRKAQQVNDPMEKQKLQAEFSKNYPAHQKFETECMAKAITIAKAEPQTEAGLDATVWAAPSLRAKPQELKTLIDGVVTHHLTSKKISGFISILSFQANSDPKAIDLIESIAAKNPHKEVQAGAVFAVAEFYKNKAEPYGKKAPDDAEELMKKAEAAFERVIKDYGDVVQFNKRTFGDAAKATLFEVRNLRVGKVVPDVEGEDVDGVKFKISDYRGKVVMLDFWGHW